MLISLSYIESCENKPWWYYDTQPHAIKSKKLNIHHTRKNNTNELAEPLPDVCVNAHSVWLYRRRVDYK